MKDVRECTPGTHKKLECFIDIMFESKVFFKAAADQSVPCLRENEIRMDFLNVLIVDASFCFDSHD